MTACMLLKPPYSLPYQSSAVVAFPSFIFVGKDDAEFVIS